MIYNVAALRGGVLACDGGMRDVLRTVILLLKKPFLGVPILGETIRVGFYSEEVKPLGERTGGPRGG